MPNALLIDGTAYPIRTDFRVGIEFQRVAANGGLTAGKIMKLWFPGPKPENIPETVKAISMFVRRRDLDAPQEDQEESGPTPYDLTVDSDVIAAGFMEKYGIDLTDPGTEMHWWRFVALLEGLSGLSFAQRVEVRTKDLSGMKAKERAHWMKLRNRYAIHKNVESFDDHMRHLDEIIARGGDENG